MIQFFELKEPSPSYTQRTQPVEDRALASHLTAPPTYVSAARRAMRDLTVALTFLQSVQDADNNVVEERETGQIIQELFQSLVMKL